VSQNSAEFFPEFNLRENTPLPPKNPKKHSGFLGGFLFLLLTLFIGTAIKKKRRGKPVQTPAFFVQIEAVKICKRYASYVPLIH
jgi:hypothetical protein